MPPQRHTTRLEDVDIESNTGIIDYVTQEPYKGPLNRPFDGSSDPIAQHDYSNAEFSFSTEPYYVLKRKVSLEQPPPPAKRISNTSAISTTKEAILEARDLIIKAAYIAKSYEEQSKILDLLEVFREFTKTRQV